MATQPQFRSRVAFGPFEVNADADELLKGGTRIRLPGQPFQILLLLLERPGEVVTRDELRQQIWSDDTFVDFEHGLNAAVNKLRRTLGDSADNPRYIETIPGRGYRFIGTVKRHPAALVPIPETTQPVESSQKKECESPGEKELTGSGAHPSRIRAVWLLLAAAALLGIWMTWTFLKKPAPASQPVVQFLILQPPGAIFAPPISRQAFAISPDGARLAFTVTDAGGSRVWLRDLSSLELHPVPATEGAWTVFWSSDSRSIFYSVKRTLKQVNIDTGFTRTVATLPVMTMYGTWRSDDDLFLYLGQASFYRVNAKTGSVEELPGTSMRWSQFLPGSDSYIHVVFDPSTDHYRAVATDFATHQSTPLLETDSRIQYSPPRQSGDPGHLLFVRGGTLLAQPFDAAHLQLKGEPFPLAQNIVYYRPVASACFSVSSNGVLVYQSGFPLSELRWYDRAGRVACTTKTAPFSGTVRISPDGQRVAADVFTPETGTRDIWLFDENGKESRRLTYPAASHRRPVWSPDGSRIAFGYSHTSVPLLATINTNESSKDQPFFDDDTAKHIPSTQIQIPTDWSHDGRYIAYDTSLGEEEREVWLLDVATKKVMPLLQNGSSQWGAAFSPDGHQVAFISDESGRPEIYVQSFEPSPIPHLTGDRKQLSRNGAWLVRWRPDGHELFFLGVDARLYAVQIEHGSPMGEPDALFQVPGNPQYGSPADIQFDVAPGGQRFVITTIASALPPPYVVVQNWQDKFRH